MRTSSGGAGVWGGGVGPGVCGAAAAAGRTKAKIRGRARLQTFIGAPSRFGFPNLCERTDIPLPLALSILRDTGIAAASADGNGSPDRGRPTPVCLSGDLHRTATPKNARPAV